MEYMKVVQFVYKIQDYSNPKSTFFAGFLCTFTTFLPIFLSVILRNYHLVFVITLMGTILQKIFDMI